MRNKIKLLALQTFVISTFCFTAETGHALVVKGVVVESGGTSSSSSGTSSSCIGGPVSGKYSSGSYSGSSGCTTEVPGTDSDGDTMSDTWETTYALNKYDATDRYADPDADNCTNACEKGKDTIPKGSGTACPGFSTTTSNDWDCDGITDMDDPSPKNASVTTLTVNGTYKGGKLQSTNIAN